MENIQFLDYDKITDTVMYLSQNISLNFCVVLTRKNKTGNSVLRFHSEYSYNSEYLNKTSYSIKRNFNAYFVLNDNRNYQNSFPIRAQDLVLLQMIMQNGIIPWIIGPKRIYGLDDNKNIVIKGKWKPVDFPISDYKYISFMPIVVVYEDGATKEGIRLVINDKNNFIDLDINKFMEFYYYICNTDIYCAATNLLNYVKMGPHGVNLTDMNNGGSYSYSDNYNAWSDEGKSNKKNTFFENL